MPVEIKLYTAIYCGYCRAAKALLDRHGAAYEEIDCTLKPQLRRMLIERTGQRTVPQVFIGDVPIGGFDELRALDRAGVLARILAGAAPPEEGRLDTAR
jgi:glutaredoxin 3